MAEAVKLLQEQGVPIRLPTELKAIETTATPVEGV
jgi:hypothetical protein